MKTEKNGINVDEATIFSDKTTNSFAGTSSNVSETIKNKATVPSTNILKLTINIGKSLPGKKGDPIYASATVAAYGDGITPPSKYLLWDKYKSGTSDYTVNLKDPSTTATATKTITKVVGVTSHTTTMAASIPAVVKTKILTTSGPSTSVEVADASAIAKKMVGFGGIAAGDDFGGAIVESIKVNSLTLNKKTIGVGVTAEAPVTFTSLINSSNTIEVSDSTGIKPGMAVSGGMLNKSDQGFAAKTTVDSVSGNKITLNKPTIANVITEGSEVIFSQTPIYSDQLILDNVADLVAGMCVSGGASASKGDAFNPNTFISAINKESNTITLSENFKLNSVAKNSTMSFFSPVPSIQIGEIGTASTLTLLIPGGDKLSGGRIIFTLEKPGNFPFNSAHQPTAPAPYKGNVTNLFYDFVEFAWTLSSKGVPNLNYDTSIVDQFGLPITIEFGTAPILKRGVKIDRENVITKYNSDVPAAIKLGIITPTVANASTFFSALSTIMSPYRILAPADAFLLAAEHSASTSIKTAVAGVDKYFDGLIKAFFDKYDATLPGGTDFNMENVAGVASTGKGKSGFHDLTGKVIKVSAEGTDGKPHQYRVLKLTDTTPGITKKDGSEYIYQIFEPFFSSNGYTDKPLPPKWLIDGMDGTNPIPTAITPTEMVFGASGVFADSSTDGTGNPTPNGDSNTKYQILLGAIENQIVTAINRGIVLAPQWRWLYQASSNAATSSPTPQVTVNIGNTLTLAAGAFVPVYKGMSINGTKAIGVGTPTTPNTVTDVSFSSDGTTTVTLSIDNTEEKDNVVVIFSYDNISNPFYCLKDPMTLAPFHNMSFENYGVWNYFSQFFHKKSISIDGLAYAYAFDDQGNFSTDISKDNPTNTIVNLGN